jgi:hypothetical protein
MRSGNADALCRALRIDRAILFHGYQKISPEDAPLLPETLPASQSPRIKSPAA